MKRIDVSDIIKDWICERDHVVMLMEQFQITPAHMIPLLSPELHTFLSKQDLTLTVSQSKELDNYLSSRNLTKTNIDHESEKYRKQTLRSVCSYLKDWYDQELRLNLLTSQRDSKAPSVPMERVNAISFKFPISVNKLREEFSKEYIRRSLQILVSHGFDPNTRDNNGATLLHHHILRYHNPWSKEWGYVSLIQCILEIKADPNMAFTYESFDYVKATRTTLKLTCKEVPSSYKEQVVSLLLDAGAIVRPDKELKTFMKYNMVDTLKKCNSMGFEIYWPIDRFLKSNMNEDHVELHNLNRSIDMSSIETIKVLLLRQERQFYMQVDSLWGLILSFIYPNKKRRIMYSPNHIDWL
jgi:hypothetical protein